MSAPNPRKPRTRTKRRARPASRGVRLAWLAGLAAVVVLAGLGARTWSGTRQGRAALLALGSDRLYTDVQAAVDEVLAAELPGYTPGSAPAWSAAATGADCDWPAPGFGAGAAIRCRRLLVADGEPWWEMQARLSRALGAAGTRVLWGERLPYRTGNGGSTSPPDDTTDALRLDLGVSGRPTHTLVLQRADHPRDVSWGGGGGQSAWAELLAGDGPVVALVIDDWGYSRSDAARRILDLPTPLTLAVLPGLSYSRYYALQRTELVLPPESGTVVDRDSRRERRSAGCPVEVGLVSAADRALLQRREIMLHLPMEPQAYPENDPGPLALMIGMERADIAARLDSALVSLPGVTGVNNHMGSAATSDPQLMADLMAALAERGLFFVDSVTASGSVAAEQARASGLPTAENRIFLDYDNEDPKRIRANLERLVAAARRTGFALGIGHPHPATADVLVRELPRLRAAGVRFVTVSEFLALRAATAGGI